MNIVARNDGGEFAPFDLTQTPKFDRKTDKVALAIRSYEIANKYLAAAKLLLEKSFEYMPVVLANVAFSCELYLKALLHGYAIDFGNTGHGLNDLFQLLPDYVRDYVSHNIAIENRDTEFDLSLKEQNTAFVTYRYMNEVKAITANPGFLFAFALVLKFVYEVLSEIPSKQAE